MLTTIAVQGYRSLREFRFGLKRINLIEGANGTGKTNVYRALRLLVEAAEGKLIQTLAKEGGLQSVLWAGPAAISRNMMIGAEPVQGTLRKGPVRLLLGLSTKILTYMIDLGLPIPIESAFSLDPVVKREWLWIGSKTSASNLLLDRKNQTLKLRNGEDWEDIDLSIGSTQSMLGEYADPKRAPELITLRDSIRNWRFYDHWRTDAAAPARQPAVGTFTPVLSGDGSDLAPAIQTILEIGDGPSLHQIVSDAFPGSRIVVDFQSCIFRVGLQQTGMLRPLMASELSDGTLRFLLLTAALLTPRPPELMILNEPETSLHPELLPALGRLIESYGERNQIVVVTHAQPLVQQLKMNSAVQHIQLEKVFGQTQITNVDLFDLPAWKWPKR